jgi:hypothetical protein
MVDYRSNGQAGCLKVCVNLLPASTRPFGAFTYTELIRLCTLRRSDSSRLKHYRACVQCLTAARRF